MKLLILVNARSGNGAGGALGRALKDHGEVREIVFERLNEQLSDGAEFDCIMVGGGDGTISAVLTSPALPDRPVAPIPLGTANDLARELGIVRALRGVAWGEIPLAVTHWRARPFSTWKAAVGGLTIPFTSYCSLGFEGRVVNDFHHWRTSTRGASRLVNRAMYSLCGLRRITTRLQGFSLDCDSSRVIDEGRCMSLIVTNIRSYLGLGLSNSISLPHDDRLECVTTTSLLDYMRIIGATSGIIHPPKIMCTGSAISISSLPPGTDLQIDGEPQAPAKGSRLDISLARMVTVMAPQ